MYLSAKNVEELGFIKSGLFSSKYHHHYYAKRPKSRKIYIIDNFDQSISHFVLTNDEWEDFEENDLSLVPIGCCCATGNRHKENPIVDFMGDFKNVFGTRKKTLAFIEKLMERGDAEE